MQSYTTPQLALEAIRRAGFLHSAEGGPLRDEIILMSDLLRNEELPAADAKRAEDAVVRMMMQANGKKMQRAAWQLQLTQLVVDGAIRRGHVLALIMADTLRKVGFAAQELLDAQFDLLELRQGGYSAKELRAIGLKAGELGHVGYTPKDLHAGGYTAKNMREAEFTAAEMKAGGYTAKNLKDVGFSPAELKANGFSATELREGTFSAKDLKPLGYTARDLRR